MKFLQKEVRLVGIFMYFPTHRSPIKIHLVVGFAWSLVRARTQRTSRRGARATTDKNVPTRFFLLPFLTLSPFHRPLPAPPSPPFILVLFGMDEARGTCEIAVETRLSGRDETSRAEPCGRYPARLRGMIKRRG